MPCPHCAASVTIEQRRRHYKLSLRDRAEMFLNLGFVFTHAAIRVDGRWWSL